MPHVAPLPVYTKESFTIVSDSFANGTLIDMRTFVPKILDQSYIGSCVGNAVAADLNFLSYRTHDATQWSALGIYQDSLIFENRVGQEGLNPYDAYQVLKTQGIGREVDWPYDPLKIAQTPPQIYRDHAQTISGAHEITLDPDNFLTGAYAVRAALAEGRPVLVSFTAREWIRNMGHTLATQQVELAQTNGFDQTIIGGHEVLIVGYDPKINGGSFIFQNSWGTTWGDHGYGEMGVTWIQDWTTAVVIDGFAGKDYTYTPNKIFAAELYVAEMGRAADFGGLNYWAAQIAATSLNAVSQIVYNMGVSTAGTDNNTQAITHFYQNVLGRAPDTPGLDYWNAKLVAGETRGALIVELMAAVMGYVGIDIDALHSQALFKDKVAVSAYNAVMLENNDIASSMHALLNVTYDPQSVEIAKIGIHHDLGFA